MAKRLDTSELWDEYRSLRNKAINKLREAKRSFLTAMSEKLGDSKQFWGAYHSMTSSHDRVPASINNGASTATTPVAKATMLNNHFSSFFNRKPTEVINTPTVSALGSIGISTLQCTTSDVLQAIIRLRPKVACGPDGITCRMIKKCASVISEPLASIFNCSLETGCLPLEWKHSNIVPIFKSGDPAAVGNYRPISLLSITSKLLERLIHNALLSHVIENKLISDKQFGFRPGSSTQEAILSATRDWHETMERKESVACIFFDLSKAFDSLPHHLVLDTLARCGVFGPLLRWFQCYLSERWQPVVLDGECSEKELVRSGVPQGSILGPLLFILTVDPMLQLCYSPGTTISMYADDIDLYKAISKAEDQTALQADVTLVQQWTSCRDLRLNQNKTKALVITRKKKPPAVSVHLNGSPIEQVSSYRYLGVTITDDLSWGKHINTVCCKAKRTLGFLYRCFGRSTGRRPLVRLYQSLVLPVLDYCCSVWDPQQKTNIDKLERVQTFAARLATGHWMDDQFSLREELGWCPLSTRRAYQKLCLCRRITTGKSLIPPSAFKPHPSPSKLRHTNSLALFRPRARTSYTNHSFFISTIPLWNSLPEAVVKLLSNIAFKKHLKLHLCLST